ncbi:hypothetical protein RFF05_06695 [Bengtsoniella intestinalis]|uniref:hypothetical protein n=1 Tax=Bengtsoniella intestinalis TaxID=3073143 RepID=UPI00391F5F03
MVKKETLPGTERCNTCKFRAGESPLGHKCDYVLLTGSTRLAQPPSECDYYVKDGIAIDQYKRRRSIAIPKNLNRKAGGSGA